LIYIYRVQLRKALLITILLFSSPISSYEQVTSVDTQPTFEFSKSVAETPFEVDEDNKIYLYLQINSSRPLRFLLDSGTKGMCLIDYTQSPVLGLQLGKSGRLQGTGSETSHQWASQVTITMPGLKLTHIPAIIYPFNPPLTPRKRKDGILGFDFFLKFVVEINYRTHKLSVYPAQVYSYKGKSQAIHTGSISNDGPYINAEIKLPNHLLIKSQFLLDTGSGTALLFYQPFVVKNSLMENLMIENEGVLVGSAGEVKTSYLKAPYLKIGKYKVTSPLIGLIQGVNLAMRDNLAAGTIGAPALKGFKVIVDLPHERIFLEPQ
jgi:hypothetical protein